MLLIAIRSLHQQHKANRYRNKAQNYAVDIDCPKSSSLLTLSQSLKSSY